MTACHCRHPEVSRHNPLLHVENLCKQYVQRRPATRAKFTVSAFADINLAIRSGMTLAIVGESGAGKSSLARCLALLEKPTRGAISFLGEELACLRRKELARVRPQIQMIFQNPTSALNPRLTAREIIAEPLVIQGVETAARRRERTLELMAQVGLPPECENKHPLEFSGGERQRLAIARALVLEPKLLILDEALSSLDLRNFEQILGLLADLQMAKGLTYIHISHDLRLVSTVADEIAVMSQGRIVEHKRATELFAHPEHVYTQQLLTAMPSLESICAERFA